MLPIVLFVTMTLVFFCLYVYQQSFLHQTASAVAERAVDSWDNSHKQAATAPGRERTIRLLVLEAERRRDAWGVVWLDRGNGEYGNRSHAGGKWGGRQPSCHQMNHSGSMVPPEMKGEISYKNTIVQRTVRVDLTRMLSLPLLDTLLKDGSDARALAIPLSSNPSNSFVRLI
ncbi:hypothetical protein VQ056_21705 [Paenibacillus sp. JTLBN-2024]